MSKAKLQGYALDTVLYVVLGIGAVIIVLPYLWMLSKSFTPEGEIFTRTLRFLPEHLTLDNYAAVLEQRLLGRNFLNSLVVSGIQTSFVIATSVLAGYAFARLQFPGKQVLFAFILGVMMIPWPVTLIPSFLIVRRLGWVNTYQGIVAPHAVMSFGIFLMRQFFLSIPKELEEAGFIDGCSRLRSLVQIVIPLSVPAVATLAIFAFTNSWNDFMWPMITTTKREMQTIQVALAVLRSSGGAATEPWGQVMAVAALASAPTLVVYLAFQRYFQKGIVMTGLKG